MVKVAIFGSDEPIKVVECGTLAEVLRRALGHRSDDLEDYSVRVNGQTVTMDRPVEEGSLVTLVPNYKAGR